MNELYLKHEYMNLLNEKYLKTHFKILYNRNDILKNFNLPIFKLLAPVSIIEKFFLIINIKFLVKHY
jgi:hypothetical protein